MTFLFLKGGDVIIQVNSQGRFTLATLRPVNKAEEGGPGQAKGKNGKNGKNLVVYVPPGTIVRECLTSKKQSQVPGNQLADLNKENEFFVVAKGGRGGRGNRHFVTKYERSPEKSEEGVPGDDKFVFLELKSIADIGLVVKRKKS